jgi:DNA-binding LacI/PurR family transcriptional regulator
VTQDNAQAIHDLVHGLKLMGHNEIAFVSGPRDYVHSIQRLDAWRSAARKEKVAHSRVLHGDFTHESGVAAANELLASGTIPSAVFCANDLMAIGFQNRLHELGMRIPDDIAIAGFDGIPLSAYVRPALTTVATDPHGLGREAGRLLVSQISGDDGEASTIGPAELVWRDSTGPMRR